jgi:hypothetical protein
MLHGLAGLCTLNNAIFDKKGHQEQKKSNKARNTPAKAFVDGLEGRLV